MIVITGARGFIGTNLCIELNTLGYDNLLLVDDWSINKQHDYSSEFRYSRKISRNGLFDYLKVNKVEVVFHLGARTDTMSSDRTTLFNLNTNYTLRLERLCSEKGIKFIFASSAATYGNGENGFNDAVHPDLLRPLNYYAESKNEYDKLFYHNLHQGIGFKFFNVYGPFEFHKGRMSSVMYHFRNQINECDTIKLFKSYNRDYAHGEQLRDFIFVKDVARVLIRCFERYTKIERGIYNLGSGKASTYNAVAENIFKHFKKDVNIEYIEMPSNLIKSYQYYTCADMTRFEQNIGYNFTDLSEGIAQYLEFLSAWKKY